MRPEVIRYPKRIYCGNNRGRRHRKVIATWQEGICMPDFFPLLIVSFGIGNDLPAPAQVVWFTFRTGFVQFRYIRQFGKSLQTSTPSTAKPGLPHFSHCVRVLRRAWVAVPWPALRCGLPPVDPAVFWMWVAAFIGMATSLPTVPQHSFIKNVMPMGSFVAGPARQMARGLGMRWMAFCSPSFC
ncbi:alanine:cation symporter family protein [Shigella flexneri]